MGMDKIGNILGQDYILLLHLIFILYFIC